MLTNRLYRGEIRHGAKWYPGRHPAIVDAEIFEAVQAKLAEQGGTAGQRFRDSAAPLKGLVFDDAGHPMSPHHAQKAGRRHHYYVSLAVMRSREVQPGIAVARLRRRTRGSCRRGMRTSSRLAAPLVRPGAAHTQDHGPRIVSFRLILRLVEAISCSRPPELDKMSD